VLALVGAGEIIEKKPGVETPQFIVIYVQAFAEDPVVHLQELRFIQDSVVQGARVRGQPLGEIRAESLFKFLGVGSGRRDGQGRIAGIDVDRADIELELRPDLLEVEQAGPADALGRDEAEAHPLPAAPFPLLKDELLVLDDDLGDRVPGIDVDPEVDRRLGTSLPEAVIRPGQFGLDPVADDIDLVDAAAASDLRADLPGFVGIVIEDAVRPFEVGGPHSGESPLLRLDGRVIGRDLEDGRRDVVLLEDLPEGLALAEVLDASAG
jgi:hypothetical protein